MSRFVDKIAGALGFTTDENDNQNDDYDDYEEYEDDGYQSSRNTGRNSSYSRNNYRTDSNAYSRSEGYNDSNLSRPDPDGGYSGGFRSSYGSSGYTGSRPSYGNPETGNSGPAYKTMGYRTSSSTGANGSKILNLNASVQMEVVVASPESFDEARQIAQSIKENKPVIINLEFVEHSVAQRMTDFLCGCCCAVDGNIQRIADKIFMIAPGNVDFAGDVDIRQSLQTEGLAFPIGGGQQQ